MANKTITPGTSGNLSTALGGAPGAGDDIYINEGGETYSTVPDWTGTAIDDVFIGPGFLGNIGTSAWGIQADVVVNQFSGQFIYITVGVATTAEIRHQPSAGGLLQVEGAALGVLTTLHSWGPCIIASTLPTLTNAYIHGGHTIIRTGTNALSGTFTIDPGAEVTLERDYAACTVYGTLTMNSTAITPSGTTTVGAGGVLHMVKSGTWTAVTGTLTLLPGAILDITRLIAPVQLENLTHHVGAIIRKVRNGVDYTVNGTETTVGGGATIEYVG